MASDVQTQAGVEIPTGTWTVDPVHSVAGFAVRHMIVGTFRGEFDDVDATLTDGELVGKVKVASLKIKDEKLKGHLFSPDFFDVERFPEIVYESSSLAVEDGVLRSEGNLSVKDRSVPVSATGRIAGPAVTLGEVEKIGIDLQATVDRDAVGLAWNAPLPKGGFVLGDEVTITVTLELARVDDED
jgi:polyisoprenoid-binding protein YceI